MWIAGIGVFLFAWLVYGVVTGHWTNGPSDCQKAYNTQYVLKGTQYDIGEKQYCDNYSK